jgi:hypothetical protein
MFPLKPDLIIRTNEDMPLACAVVELLQPYWAGVNSRCLSNSSLRRKACGFNSLTYMLFDECSMFDHLPADKLSDILDFYRVDETFELSYRLTIASSIETQTNFDNVCRDIVRQIN